MNLSRKSLWLIIFSLLSALHIPFPGSKSKRPLSFEESRAKITAAFKEEGLNIEDYPANRVHDAIILGRGRYYQARPYFVFISFILYLSVIAGLYRQSSKTLTLGMIALSSDFIRGCVRLLQLYDSFRIPFIINHGKYFPFPPTNLKFFILYAKNGLVFSVFFFVLILIFKCRYKTN